MSNNRTFTVEKLLEMGYEKSTKGIEEDHKTLYQKCIRQILTNRKAFFINVYKFDWTYGPKDNPNYEFSSGVHFYLDNEGNKGFQVHYNINSEKTTVEEMELFFVDVYNKMKCVVDPHNNQG